MGSSSKPESQKLLGTGPQPDQVYVHYKGDCYEVVCRLFGITNFVQPRVRMRYLLENG